jgi:hypothetical protein
VSRSRRRTPIFTYTTGSGTDDRRRGNRALRHAVRQQLIGLDADLSEANVLPCHGEIHATDPWDWDSDGRGWMGDWIAGMDERKAAVEMSK